MRVLVRVRPPNARELDGGYAKSIHAHSDTQLSVTRAGSAAHAGAQGTTSSSSFAYDYVCDETQSQEAIFERVGAPIVDGVVEGFHGCVLAYGQTGAGKTYTMQGVDYDDDGRDDDDGRGDRGDVAMGGGGEVDLNAAHAGLIPRVLRRLFARVESERARVAEAGGDAEFDVKCSYLEIYNETLRDLLMNSEYDGPAPNIREDNKRGTFVENLLEERVVGAEQTYETFLRGAANRRVGQTNMNADSSRSHSVFTISVESRTKANPTAPVTKKSALLHLVDLAGSERQKSTDAAGERLKEASAINKSLSALGNVIKALVDLADGKERHVPYRDSKLTFLLKDALGGRARCSLLACVSPAHVNVEETLSTLKFAQRAKLVKVRAVANEEAVGSSSELAAEVSRLRALLAEGGGDGGMNTKVKILELEAIMAKANRAASAAAKDSEGELEKLKAKLADAKELCTCLDKNLQSAKMVIRLRDEALKKKALTPELLDAEHAELRKQVEHPPEVVRVRMELAALQERADALQAENERSANRGRLATAEAELKDLRKLVVAEGELTAKALDEKAEALAAHAQIEQRNKILEAAIEAAERRAVESEEAAESARTAQAAAEVLEHEHKMNKQAAEADRARIEATFAENKEVMEEMFGKLETLMAYKVQADREKAELEILVAEATAKAAGASSSFEETTAALAAARKQLEQSKADIDAALDEQRAEHEKALSAHVAEHQAKLAAMSSAHQSALRALESSRDAEIAAVVNAQAEAVNKAKEDAESAFDAERAAHAVALSAQAAELEAKFAKQLTDVQTAHEASLAALHSEHVEAEAKIRADMRAAQAELVDAHASKFSAQAEAFAEQIEKINATHASAIEALEVKHAGEMAAFKERLAIAEARDVAEDTMNCKEHFAELAAVKTQHDEALETLENEYKAQIAALEHTLEQRQDAEMRLTARVEEMKATHAREIDELRSQMAAMDETQVDVEESLRVKITEESNKVLEDVRADHEIALEEQKSTLSAAFAADIRNAEKKLAMAKEEVNKAKTAAAAEFTAAGHAQMQIRQLQADLEAKDDELKNLERRLASASRSDSDTTGEDASWAADAQSRADARLEVAKAARKRAEERAADMEAKMTALMNDVEDAQKAAAASKTKSSAAHARIESLEVALHAAKTEIAQLKGIDPPVMASRTPSRTPALKRPAPGRTPGKTPGTMGTARRILSAVNAAAAPGSPSTDAGQPLKKHMRFESPAKSDTSTRPVLSRRPELEGIRRGTGRLLSKPAMRVQQNPPPSSTE